jgi:single-strand DNA-binding protein
VDCAYWTERTAVAQYLKKGTQIYVEGQPDIRTYTTQDGRQGASLTLRVGNLQLLGGRSGDNSSSDSGNSSGYSSPASSDAGGADDSTPF